MCDVCSGRIDNLDNWEKEQTEKHGFYAHLVPDEESGYINAHTHGFQSSWNHSDFQIVLPIDSTIIMNIFNRLAELVKSGEKFEAATRIKGVIKGDLLVQFESSYEGGRDVLRVVLPDKDGHLPGDLDIDEAYQKQVSVLGGVRQEGERS